MILTTIDPLAAFEAALVDAMGDLGETVTVGPGIPSIDDPDVAAGWPTDHPPHIQIDLDGHGRYLGDTRVRPVFRITTWAATPEEAHRLADLACAAFVADPGPNLAGAERQLDPIPATDDLSGAALSTASVAATVRRKRTA